MGINKSAGLNKRAESNKSTGLNSGVESSKSAGLNRGAESSKGAGLNKGSVVLGISFLATAILGYYLIGQDLEILIRFWAVMCIMGMMLLPHMMKLCTNLTDGGYFVSKILGLAVSGYVVWLLSSLHILKFTTANCLIIGVLLFVLSYGAAIWLKKKKEMPVFFKECMDQKRTLQHMIAFEILFLLVWILFTYLLGNKIPGCDTEKSMDYAFMTVMNRTEYMPPVDMWASGTTLNYYYFGQYLMTFLTKLSGTAVKYGYSVTFSMIAAGCFTLVFYLVYHLMHFYLKNQNIRHKTAAAVCSGLTAAAMVTLAGNMHYVLFGKIVPAIWEILQIPLDKPTYWFASSTRYIGYVPDVSNDKTISEFPIYSFLIGDLHAHVIDILIVLTILILLMTWVFQMNEKKEKQSYVLILIVAFLLGICSMTNYWDFPIYYVVSGSVILTCYLIHFDIKNAIVKTLIAGASVMAVIQLVSLPFQLKFDKMIMGIRLCSTHSKLYQLFILWGFPILILVFFIIGLVMERNREKKGMISFLGQMQRSDCIVLLLGLCGAGLVLIPEIIYVKDIYEAGFPRANTMFKLTYEAFILLGIASSYSICRWIINPRTKKQRKGGIIALCLLLMTVGYFFTASSMWLGEYWNKENYKGIDATAYFEEALPTDMKAIHWLTENVEGQPVVLEADGNSYTQAGRVSVLTGFPTVLGWHTHEWLWKNGNEINQERETDITEIYTGTDVERTKELINQYQIEYIFIGTQEYQKYSVINSNLLKTIGEVVYHEKNEENQDTMIIQISGK